MQVTYWIRPSSSIGGGVMRIIPVPDHLSCLKNGPNNMRRFSMDIFFKEIGFQTIEKDNSFLTLFFLFEIFR